MVTLRIGSCLFLWVTFCGAPTLVAAAGAHDSRPVLTGIVTKVIDADTIDVKLASGPIRVRFHGIDAPERGQPGGAEASTALKRWILNKEIDLEPFEQDRYDRMIAIVFRADTNINAKLVSEGYAWAYRQYMRKGDAELCRDEAEARIAKRGVWALPPDSRTAPWEYRKRKTMKAAFTDYSRHTTAQCIAAIGKR
jgi:micrococcal nuclease